MEFFYSSQTFRFQRPAKKKYTANPPPKKKLKGSQFLGTSNVPWDNFSIDANTQLNHTRNYSAGCEGVQPGGESTS
jgi:hypothetical protein